MTWEALLFRLPPGPVTGRNGEGEDHGRLPSQPKQRWHDANGPVALRVKSVQRTRGRDPKDRWCCSPRPATRQIGAVRESSALPLGCWGRLEQQSPPSIGNRVQDHLAGCQDSKRLSPLSGRGGVQSGVDIPEIAPTSKGRVDESARFPRLKTPELWTVGEADEGVVPKRFRHDRPEVLLVRLHHAAELEGGEGCDKIQHPLRGLRLKLGAGVGAGDHPAGHPRPRVRELAMEEGLPGPSAGSKEVCDGFGEHGRAELLRPGHGHPAFVLGHGEDRAAGVEAPGWHSWLVGSRGAAEVGADHVIEYELCYREEKERSEDKNAGTRHPFPPIPAPTLTPKRRKV